VFCGFALMVGARTANQRGRIRPERADDFLLGPSQSRVGVGTSDLILECLGAALSLIWLMLPL
jgi:hypothetical protein